MSEELARSRAKRGGNRTVLTKLANEAHDLLKEEVLNRPRLKILAESISEKLEIVKSLDEAILETCKVEDIELEIEESYEINVRALETRRRIMDALAAVEKSPDKSDNKEIGGMNVPLVSLESPPISGDEHANEALNLNSGSPSIHVLGSSNATHAGNTQSSGSSNANTLHSGNTQSSGSTDHAGMVQQTNFSSLANPKAKLPKLVLPKFKGVITQWQTFWDSFNSAIHVNPHLSPIDKFNHLHSLLEGQAARAIQGLTRTDANYQSAIEILQNRFGRPQNIISTHMDELLKIPGCTSDKASQLRFVYDKISVNVRGLESLGVSSSQYGSLLIPVIMSKLPQEVRIQVARNTAQEVWQMSDILDVIRQEVEAREISEGVKVNADKPNPTYNQMKTPSAAALSANVNESTRPLPAGNQIKCAYCRGGHYSASCDRVTDLLARLEIIRRDRRCFVCLRFGHQSSSCSLNCRRCHGKHHQSLCRQTNSPRESSNPNEYSQNTQTLVGHVTNSHTMDGHAANTQPQRITTAASSETKGHVLLQTATALATNQDGSKSTRVKILFDCGSQRSYLTDSLKSRLSLKPTRTETLQLNTFGERNFRKQKCDVVTLHLESCNDETVDVSVLSFPAICSPLPTKVDASSYPHLQGLQLADCSDSQDSTDVLIGSDYYWDFVTNEIVRGDFGPTAINSKFGWLLSGPAEFATSSETTVTNLIISGNSNGLFDHTQDPLIDTLKQFWETESIGIKGELECEQSSDCFNGNVRFNGERYEVELPWKENRPVISSDYDLCVDRLKSLQRRLLKDPELIQEYHRIIEDQISQGIVEKVPAEQSEVNEGETVHYLPHHGVIRRDRETTKLRIVYDGSAKPPGRNHSLNDCLQTGPNYTPQLFDTLVKFRWHKIGLTADIEKAFLMVGISETDKDMLRFLWLKDPGDLNSEIEHLRFTKLVFGL